MIFDIIKTLIILVVIAAIVLWIYSLCMWDGTYPCNMDDCKGCPYSGLCENEKELKEKNKND